MLQVLGSSPTVDTQGIATSSNTVDYIAPSGALVFASGSLNWTWALDSYRLHADAACAAQGPVEPGIQKLMAHVMNALVILHPPGHLAIAPADSSSLRDARLVRLAGDAHGYMGERNA